MVWYVALIAILNLGLGYALAVYLGAGGRRGKSSRPVSGSDVKDDYGDSDDHDADDFYDDAEADEYETADVN